MESAESAVSQLSVMVLQALLPVVALLAMWGARKLISAFEAKSKIDVSQKTEAQIEEWIMQAIALAEEKTRKSTKTALGTITGPEKLEIASQYVLDLIKKYELDKKVGAWGRDKVKDLVEARLPETRGA
jgi:hypothetical protein